MHDIIIKLVRSSSPEYPEVWELREEILRNPLGLSLRNEDLSDDAMDAIFIALHDGKVIGCVMMHPVADNCIKLRQMAVYDAWQGKGVGQLLVRAAEKFSWEEAYDKIVLHARQHAIGFYLKMGYEVRSEVFTEVNIPHVVMEKVRPVDSRFI